MPLRAIARMIQTMLYAKRFFPYYVYNILGGIEEDGEYRVAELSHLRLFPRSGFYLVRWLWIVSCSSSVTAQVTQSRLPPSLISLRLLHTLQRRASRRVDHLRHYSYIPINARALLNPCLFTRV